MTQHLSPGKAESAILLFDVQVLVSLRFLASFAGHDQDTLSH